MRKMMLLAVALPLMIGAASASAQAPVGGGPPVPGAARTTDPFRFLDGVWVGEARMYGPGGQAFVMDMTERVGPMLGGEVRAIEGVARDKSGRTLFNAFSVLSPASANGAYQMRSYTPGRTGDYDVRLTAPNSFGWSYSSAGAQFRYRVEVSGGVWREVGERVAPDGSVAKHFEMTLRRTADTDWPAAFAKAQGTVSKPGLR